MDKGAQGIVAAGNAPGTLCGGYPVQVAHFVLQARVGQGLHGKERIEVSLVRHIIKDGNGRVFAVDQPVSRLGWEGLSGQGVDPCVAHPHCPPRRLSS